MLRRTVNVSYLLSHTKFPPGNGSVIWLAPCASHFKQDALNSNILQKSSFVFFDGNKVEPEVFSAPKDVLPEDPTVVVVSAQKVGTEFFQAWRNRTSAEETLTLIRRGTSLGSIDLKAAEEHNVKVIGTPGINSPHVAQYVFDTLALEDAKAEEVKAVVIGFGTVGRCVVGLMNKVGVSPSVLTDSSMKVSTEAELSALQTEKYDTPTTSAVFCSSLDDALHGATHIAVCCPSPADGQALLTEARIEKLLAASGRSKVHICCIARPDVFSVDGILRFAKDESTETDLLCTFDYGDTVLAPVRKQVDEKTDGKESLVEKRLAWTTKAMHSEACKEDMDEAVLRIMNPGIEKPITMELEGMRVGGYPAICDSLRGTLGVLGGPSAWMQAFLHLSGGDVNSVVYYRPGLSAIWHTSGRQASLREKVTKFTPFLTGPKNLQISADDDKKALLLNLCYMGTAFLYERYCDAPHEAALAQVKVSIDNYRKLNAFLVSVGEKPIWIETGRLVIAGSVEQTALYKKVRAWRERKGLVDVEKVSACEEFLNNMATDDDAAPLLFHAGYVGYPLCRGGFIVPNAEEVVHRALKRHFGARFRTVESSVEHVKALPDSYLMSAADQSTTEVGRLYMSPGATPVVEVSKSSQQHTRLCPPVLITGFSGVVRQCVPAVRRGRILSVHGASSLTDMLFRTSPAAYMTDDFELTVESVEESEDGDSVIRWRITGCASINSGVCKVNPETALVAPVRRFLSGDIAIEEMKHCSRHCGPQFAEQITSWGPRGRIALSWGHWGVTLAGQDMWGTQATHA